MLENLRKDMNFIECVSAATFFYTLPSLSVNAYHISLFQSVGFVSHSVKYISHTVVFVFHSVGQRIHPFISS